MSKHIEMVETYNVTDYFFRFIVSSLKFTTPRPIRDPTTHRVASDYQKINCVVRKSSEWLSYFEMTTAQDLLVHVSVKSYSD